MSLGGHNHAFAVHGPDGKRIATISSVISAIETSSTLPPFIYSNLIFIEDKTFKNHFGVSIRGICRALVASVRAGRFVQGGSTITQQLFRTLYPIRNRFFRKAAEIICSPLLTTILGRRRILDLYLNRVYFGRSIVGVKAASRAYFKKSCSELTQQESLVLISLLSRPNYWLKNPGKFSKKILYYSKALNVGGVSSSNIEGLTRRISKNAASLNVTPDFFPKFSEYMSRFARSQEKVTLPFNLDIQSRVLNHVNKYRMNAFVAIMDCRTKQLKVVVDCIDIGESNFPTLFSNSLELGSLLKPILILLAVQKNIVPSNLIFHSRPIEVSFEGYSSWRVSNFANKYRGAISLDEAIAESDNSVCVQALKALGFSDFVELLVVNGIIRDIDRHKVTPAIVLGASSAPVNLVALMKLYSEFATMRSRSPDLLSRRRGDILSSNKVQAVIEVRKALKKTIVHGTAKQLRYSGIIGAKTGTSGLYESMMCFDRENLYLIIHKEKVDYVLREQWLSQFDKSYRVADFAKSLIKDMRIFLKSIVNPNELYGKDRRSA